MNSRERILSAIKKNQPGNALPLPEMSFPEHSPADLVEKFAALLVSIGGKLITLDGWKDLQFFVEESFPGKNVVTTIPSLADKVGKTDFNEPPRHFAGVDLAILQGEFAVAENGAVWITDNQMGDRALPFIAENLALVVDKKNILPTLHEAYKRIGSTTYNFGTFIAGPSKTADIEQSLVLGAHGAKSLTVFLIDE